MKLSSRDSVDAIQNGNDIHHEDSELNPKLNDNMHGINYIPQCLPLFNFGRHDHNIFPTNPVNKIKKKTIFIDNNNNIKSKPVTHKNTGQAEL